MVRWLEPAITWLCCMWHIFRHTPSRSTRPSITPLFQTSSPYMSPVVYAIDILAGIVYEFYAQPTLAAMASLVVSAVLLFFSYFVDVKGAMIHSGAGSLTIVILRALRAQVAFDGFNPDKFLTPKLCADFPQWLQAVVVFVPYLVMVVSFVILRFMHSLEATLNSEPPPLQTTNEIRMDDVSGCRCCARFRRCMGLVIRRLYDVAPNTAVFFLAKICLDVMHVNLMGVTVMMTFLDGEYYVMHTNYTNMTESTIYATKQLNADGSFQGVANAVAMYLAFMFLKGMQRATRRDQSPLSHMLTDMLSTYVLVAFFKGMFSIVELVAFMGRNRSDATDYLMVYSASKCIEAHTETVHACFVGASFVAGRHAWKVLTRADIQLRGDEAPRSRHFSFIRALSQLPTVNSAIMWALLHFNQWDMATASLVSACLKCLESCLMALWMVWAWRSMTVVHRPLLQH